MPAPYLDDRGMASEDGDDLEGGLGGVLGIGMMIALLLLFQHSIDQKKRERKSQ